jgi:hypothetical protein
MITKSAHRLEGRTTSNYSATAHLYTLQVTQDPLRLFQPSVSSAAIPWQWLLTVEILQLPTLRSYFHSLLCRIQLSTDNSTIAPSLLRLPCRAQLNSLPQFSITPRCGLPRQHPVSPVACVSVAMVVCLPTHCIETGLI